MIYFYRLNLNMGGQLIKLATELKEQLLVTPKTFRLFFLFSYRSSNPYPFSPHFFVSSSYISLFVRVCSKTGKKLNPGLFSPLSEWLYEGFLPKCSIEKNNFCEASSIIWNESLISWIIGFIYFPFFLSPRSSRSFFKAFMAFWLSVFKFKISTIKL